MKDQEELKHLGARARHYHGTVLTTVKTHRYYIFLTGAVLLRAKEVCGHGAFGDWVKKELPDISHGSVHRYMLTAAHLLKFPTVGNLKMVKAIESGAMPDAVDDRDAAAVDRAMHDVLAGRDITALYRDLGLVREPKKGGGRRQDAPRTAGETAACEGRELDALVKSILAPLRLWSDLPEKRRSQTRRETVKLLLDHLVDASTLCRQMLAEH